MSRLESIHLASSHPPFDTRIFHKECKTLAAAGYRVTLIVPHEREEVVDGVHIRAVPVPKDGRERLTRTIWQVTRAALDENPDAVFHFHDAELILGMLWLKLAGRRVVYDMHEDTPRQMRYQHWIPPALRRPVGSAMGFLEALGGRLFDGIIAAEPVIAARFPEERVVTVHNFPMRDELIGAGGVPYARRPPNVAYVGSITVVRGINEVVRAIGLLPEALEARLQLAGAFHPAVLRDAVSQLPGWERVEYLGWLTRGAVAELFGQARVGVVAFHPVERYLGNYPTKLFEYMAAGLPVVVSDFSQLRPFVQETGCGLMVDPLDPHAIAEAIHWLLTHPREAEAMGRRGQGAIRERFNWEREAEKLVAFYERLERKRVGAG